VAGRRIVAWLVDWTIISLYAGALVPLGLVLDAASLDLPATAWNAVAFALLVAPATIWMAAWERGPAAASPGKRLLGLRVLGLRAATAPALGWRRSLVRNGLKLALPWELGHTGAFILADASAAGPSVALGMVCGVTACLVAVGYVVSLFVGSGRTPYDRAAGTRVVRAASGS
jgi:uncharacterized RDD family membrane protein YckC